MIRSSFIRLGIFSALLVAACVGYGVCYAMVSAESAQASTLANQISSQNNAATELVKAKSETMQLSTQQATIDQYFVSTNNIVPFLEQLQSIGKYLGSDVEVSSVAATPGTPYGEITLALTINGSFTAVARTIGAIEYQPYNVTLTSLTLSAVPGGDSTASSSPAWTAAAAFTVGAETGTPATSTASVVQPQNTPVIPNPEFIPVSIQSTSTPHTGTTTQSTSTPRIVPTTAP
jgi:Tfp pilus assembly protein PilO